MKKLIIIVSTFILCSCSKHDAVTTKMSSNPDGLKVDLLFEIDSTYKSGVYRFMDNGNYHYFVISPKQNKCENTIQSGKNETMEEIETIQAP